MSKQDSFWQVVILFSHKQGWRGQSEFDFIGITLRFCGISVLSLVGPKIANVFIPKATAICNGAESEHKNFSQDDIN